MARKHNTQSWRRSNQVLSFFFFLLVPTYIFSANPTCVSTAHDFKPRYQNDVAKNTAAETQFASEGEKKLIPLLSDEEKRTYEAEGRSWNELMASGSFMGKRRYLRNSCKS